MTLSELIPAVRLQAGRSFGYYASRVLGVRLPVEAVDALEVAVLTERGVTVSCAVPRRLARAVAAYGRHLGYSVRSNVPPKSHDVATFLAQLDAYRNSQLTIRANCDTKEVTLSFDG